MEFILLKRKKVDLDNICNGVKFLIDNDNITGEIINIDGGQRLAWQTPDIINTKEWELLNLKKMKNLNTKEK